MSGYQVIVSQRTNAHEDQYKVVHREQVTPQTLAAFRSGDLLRQVPRTDDGGLMCMARVELIAPDGVQIIDTYTGPHPDEGPVIYRQVSTASRRSIANHWVAVVSGVADVESLSGLVDGDVRQAAAYVAEWVREPK